MHHLKFWLIIPTILSLSIITAAYASSNNGRSVVGVPTQSTFIIGRGEPSKYSIGSSTKTIILQLTVKDILENPEHIGSTVTLTGESFGWANGYGSPPVTKSDWVFSDGTEFIYVSGSIYQKNSSVTITGVVT